MKTVKVGVIGTGRIGKLHTENLVNNIKGAEVKAAADIMIDQAKDWLKECGVEKTYTDYKKVIEDPEIEAVFVCSPTDTHSQISIDAIKAGKHVLCEKPVDFEVKRIEEVVEAVEKYKVKFQVGFNRRFDRNNRKVHEAVAQGTIGDPHIVRITSRDPHLPPFSYIKNSGGIFVDMMIHDFDMARYITGDEVEEVYANGAVLMEPYFKDAGDVDTAIVMLKFKKGALGVIDNSRRAVYGYDQRLEVFGSKGAITSDNETPNLTTLWTPDGIVREKPLYFFLERYHDAFIAQADAFIDSILNDKPVSVNVQDGLLPVLIGKAAQKSLDTGKPVKL